MNYLKDNLKDIYGKSIHLSSSFSPNKLLSLKNSKIFFDFKKVNNQKWIFTPLDDGVNTFTIKNENSGEFICHFPDDGGNISLVKEDTLYSLKNEPIEECKWSIGKQSEIYKKCENDEEKYLWVVNGNLHVISDSYLADKWFIYKDGVTPPKEKKPDKKSSVNIIFVVVILCIFFIIIYYNFIYKP